MKNEIRVVPTFELLSEMEELQIMGGRDIVIHVHAVDGLQSKSVRVTIENLQMIPLPSILHWDQNHFVVLYGVNKSGTRFKIADPGKGKYTITKEELTTHWISSTMNGQPCGIAMFFEKRGDIQDNTESVETSKSFRVIFKYLKSYRNHFAVIISGLILGCVLQFGLHIS